jgi:hypothetical protein
MTHLGALVEPLAASAGTEIMIENLDTITWFITNGTTILPIYLTRIIINRKVSIIEQYLIVTVCESISVNFYC